MIEMVSDPDRPIAPYGTDACRDTVNTWCRRVLDRDPSIALKSSKWIIDDTPTTADSLLTDAIWCQLWYASRAKLAPIIPTFIYSSSGPFPQPRVLSLIHI